MLDKQVEFLLKAIQRANLPRYEDIGAVAARALYDKAAPTLDIRPPAIHRTEDLLIPSGEHPIPARFYWPREPSWADPLPVLLYAHGGGFTLGSLDSFAPTCQLFAAEVGCAVLAVDYRLAPEHPFPAAFDDVLAALSWLHQEADARGLDKQRIAIGGDSAGGTLAAAVALAAREQNLPLVAQLLIYPGTHAHEESRSHHDFAQGFLLERSTIQWFFNNYMGTQNRHDWRFAPQTAASHRGLPPAWITVAGFDPLRDDGLSYAATLEAAHVPVTLRFFESLIHAFFNMGGTLQKARLAHVDAINFLINIFKIK